MKRSLSWSYSWLSVVAVARSRAVPWSTSLYRNYGEPSPGLCLAALTTPMCVCSCIECSLGAHSNLHTRSNEILMEQPCARSKTAAKCPLMQNLVEGGSEEEAATAAEQARSQRLGLGDYD